MSVQFTDLFVSQFPLFPTFPQCPKVYHISLTFLLASLMFLLYPVCYSCISSPLYIILFQANVAIPYSPAPETSEKKILIRKKGQGVFEKGPFLLMTPPRPPRFPYNGIPVPSLVDAARLEQVAQQHAGRFQQNGSQGFGNRRQISDSPCSGWRYPQDRLREDRALRWRREDRS